MHDVRLEQKIPFDQIYGPIFYVLAAMLVVGLIANLLVRPVADKYFMTDAELAHEKQLAHERSLASATTGSGGESSSNAAIAPQCAQVAERRGRVLATFNMFRDEGPSGAADGRLDPGRPMSPSTAHSIGIRRIPGVPAASVSLLDQWVLLGGPESAAERPHPSLRFEPIGSDEPPILPPDSG